jgi:ribonuclease HI
MRKNWKNGAVKNRDLWERLHKAAAGHDINWIWVRGHSGNAGNERADAIANREANAMS